MLSRRIALLWLTLSEEGIRTLKDLPPLLVEVCWSFLTEPESLPFDAVVIYLWCTLSTMIFSNLVLVTDASIVGYTFRSIKCVHLWYFNADGPFGNAYNLEHKC